MAKLIVDLQSESAANPFLSADGMLNPTAIAGLDKKIQTWLKKNPEAKVTDVYVTAKPLGKFLASKGKVSKDMAKDAKYWAARHIMLKRRARPVDKTKSKAITVLTVYADLDKALAAEVKKFLSAANQHNKKADTVKAKVTDQKAVIRDQQNAEFDANVASLKETLLGAGIKDTNIVESTSMFGKTVLVKLPNGGVVSVGKSDVSKFNAAKKAAKATGE